VPPACARTIWSCSRYTGLATSRAPWVAVLIEIVQTFRHKFKLTNQSCICSFIKVINELISQTYVPSLNRFRSESIIHMFIHSIITGANQSYICSFVKSLPERVNHTYVHSLNRYQSESIIHMFIH
jgi:hypothetical protein